MDRLLNTVLIENQESDFHFVYRFIKNSSSLSTHE